MLATVLAKTTNGLQPKL